jgi:hypothetical protein
MVLVLLDGEVSSALRCSGCARAHDASTFALTIYSTLQVDKFARQMDRNIRLPSMM